MYKIQLNTYASNIADITILKNWSITKINTDQITIKNNKPKKKVTFTDNIEFYQISTNTTKKYKMTKYGNEPTDIEKFTEQYLYKISTSGYFSFNRSKLVESLKVLKLYYPVMYNLINTHYLLFNNEKRYIYTKHTIIRPTQLKNIHMFIEKHTDIVEKQIILFKFYKKYWRKN